METRFESMFDGQTPEPPAPDVLIDGAALAGDPRCGEHVAGKVVTLTDAGKTALEEVLVGAVAEGIPDNCKLENGDYAIRLGAGHGVESRAGW